MDAKKQITSLPSLIRCGDVLQTELSVLAEEIATRLIRAVAHFVYLKEFTHMLDSRDPNIDYSLDAGVFVLKINRPEKKNALLPGMRMKHKTKS